MQWKYVSLFVRNLTSDRPNNPLTPRQWVGEYLNTYRVFNRRSEKVSKYIGNKTQNEYAPHWMC